MRRPTSAMVERGLTVLALAWQAAWTALDPALWPTGRHGAAVGIALAAPWVTWFACAVATWGPRSSRRWLRPALATDVAVLCASALVVVTMTADEGAARPPATALVILAVALAGLVLPTRTALAVVVGVSLAETALLVVASTHGDPLSPSDAVLNGLQALYTGVATAGTAWALRRAAARTDEAHDALVEATRAQHIDEAVAQDVTAHERVLHDTVLNTLTAVARGGLEGRDADVRTACASAADTVRALARPDLVRLDGDDGSTSGPLQTLLHAPVAALRSHGVRVSVRGALDTRTPAEVRGALVAAATEALRNVERHAGASTVTVGLTGEPSDLRLEVGDDGRGFDTGLVTSRLGLARAVRGGMAQVGGQAEVSSAPGSGTVVVLSWRPGSPPHPDRLADAVPGLMAAATPSLVIPVTIWAGVSLAVTWSAYPLPWLALLAYVVQLALAAALVARRPAAPTWPEVLLTCAAGAAVYFLVQAAAAGAPGAVEPWGYWTSPTILGAFVAVAMAGPRWAWAVVLATWVAVQGDPLELIRPGGALIIAASLAARSVHRWTASYERAVAETVEIETRTRASREAQRRRNARYSALTATVLPVLDELAAGRLDPHDPAVRSRCREEERFARTLVRLDPDAGDVPALMSRLAVAARRRGIVLDVDLRDDVPPGLPVAPAALRQADAAFEAVFDGLRPGGGGVTTLSAPRLTGGLENGGVVLRLVAPVSGPTVDPPEGVRYDEDEGTALWEVVLPHD